MVGDFTSSSLGQLRQPQNGIVTGHRLKGDVAVPALLGALLGLVQRLLVQLLGPL